MKPRLRNLVTFSQMNLARTAYIGRFDCIFCMDVLPHFSSAQRTALVDRLHLYLEPGGYLLLGQGEKMPNANATFAVAAGDVWIVSKADDGGCSSRAVDRSHSGTSNPSAKR